MYEAEAIIPVEVGEPSKRRTNFNEGQNDEDRTTDLELLPKEREMAHIRPEAIKQRIARKYNTKLLLEHSNWEI